MQIHTLPYSTVHMCIYPVSPSPLLMLTIIIIITIIFVCSSICVYDISYSVA